MARQPLQDEQGVQLTAAPGTRSGNPHGHGVDGNLPAAVRLAAATSTWTKPKQPMLTLSHVKSHFRSWPSRHGSRIHVSPCLQLAQQRGRAILRKDSETPCSVSTYTFTGSCATLSNNLCCSHSLDFFLCFCCVCVCVCFFFFVCVCVCFFSFSIF